MSKQDPKDAAIQTLEERLADLETGINSITEQTNHLSKLRAQVALSEERLAQDKRSLVQIRDALALLKAGVTS